MTIRIHSSHSRNRHGRILHPDQPGSQATRRRELNAYQADLALARRSERLRGSGDAVVIAQQACYTSTGRAAMVDARR